MNLHWHGDKGWRNLAGLIAATALVVAGCGTGSPSQPPAKPTAIDSVTISSPVSISFWHVYSGTNGKALERLLDKFHQQYPNINVEAQFVGGYGQLHQKLVSSLQAGQPPNVAIAYENDVLDYTQSGKVQDLTPYVNSSKYGETQAALSTIVPVELKRNRYMMAGGKYLSWPFQLSESVLYYNQDLLASAGISSPPKTWSDLFTQCGQVRAKLKKTCFAIGIDASTVDGVAFSYGATSGMLSSDGKSTAFQTAPWSKTLQLYQDLVDKGYGAPTTGVEQLATDDLTAFAGQQVPFIIRTSLSITYLEQVIGSKFRWGVAMPPQGKSGTPVTVLYGANVAAFSSGSPEQRLASWLLVKFLSGETAQVDWAMHTGNLPLHLDAAKQGPYKSLVDSDARIKAAVEILPNARFEGVLDSSGLRAVVPSALRTLVESTESALVTKAIKAADAQAQLTSKGGAIVSRGG